MIACHDRETMIQIAGPTVNAIDAAAKKTHVRLATRSGMTNGSADAPSYTAAGSDGSTVSPTLEGSWHHGRAPDL